MKVPLTEVATRKMVRGSLRHPEFHRPRESASLGVGGIGSLSLPIEGGMDSMVKVASETVTQAGVYDRLFALMAGYFDAIRGGAGAPEAEAGR